MTIKIYNSKSKQKEVLKPVKEGEISMYVCGITPQNSAHLGHAVSALRFATMRRYLEFVGYKVVFVENITDIDDKIIVRSRDLGISARELAEMNVAEYREGMNKLSVPTPTHNPRVSEYIPEIIRYVMELIEKGHAYPNNDGDVYFDVASLTSYGELSNRKKEFAESGHRKAVAENKRSEVDFALWKSDSENGWESPWGVGRPGWHIECSVMANTLLGSTIDIHGGGLDLLFPHHENENAQCKAHNHREFVSIWSHAGLLNIDGVKMSKSLGNFITLTDAIKKYGVTLINTIIARHHYRSTIDFNDKLFRDNLNTVLNWWKKVNTYPEWKNVSIEDIYTNPHTESLLQDFTEVMNDDLNSPRALVIISPYLESIESFDESDRPAIIAACVKLLNIFGIFQKEIIDSVPDELVGFHQAGKSDPIARANIDEIMNQRYLARANRDYAESDRLREVLAGHSIKTIDGREELSWEFVL